MSPTPVHGSGDHDARRKAARRTVLWLVVVAVVIYVGFMLSGVVGK